jgi:hypothetical protein
MGLTHAKRVVVSALESGNYEHEPRDVMAEKNLLAVGDVSEAEVIALIRAMSGSDYSSSPHDWDREVEVHVFRPTKWGTVVHQGLRAR